MVREKWEILVCVPLPDTNTNTNTNTYSLYFFISRSELRMMKNFYFFLLFFFSIVRQENERIQESINRGKYVRNMTHAAFIGGQYQSQQP